MSTTISGPDGKPRCSWCGAAPEFLGYHDTEWGFPVGDDHHIAPGGGLESVALGFLPAGLINAMCDRFLALHERSKARFVRRTE